MLEEYMPNKLALTTDNQKLFHCLNVIEIKIVIKQFTILLPYVIIYLCYMLILD